MKTLDRIVGMSLMVLVVVAGCAPLPGDSFDPAYLKLPGKKASAEPAQAKSAAAAPEPSSPLPMGAHMWVGRYRDSGGEGEIRFSLVRSHSMMSGTWKARMGGGGPVIATLEPGGQRWQLRMESSAAECPGMFEGWLETRGAALVGTYHGKDCEGSVSDGSFELREK